MYKIGLLCEVILKLVLLVCPLIGMEVLIKEGLKTISDKILVLFLVFIFGIFLYLLINTSIVL